jgi:alcohol dehydrogenase
MSFTIYSPTRIVFGRPVSEGLPAELDVARAQRVLLVTDPVLAGLPWVRHIQTALVAADRAVALFTSVSSNPSTREVSEGLGLAQDERVQAVVALGGGSVIDAAKAIAMLLTNGGTYADYLYTDRPIEQRCRFMVAIPTTAGSGSEVTSTAVIVDPSRAGVKAVRSPLMAPHVALVDPEVTRSLPPATTAATGINAFVQVLEAYIGRQANPYTDPLAVTGMQTVWSYLPRAFAAGDDMTARQGMMLAALWGGLCSDQAGAGLIAALSGTLTAHLQLHNGLANALLLPHVMRFNLAAIPTVRQQRLNRTLGLAPDASADQLVERLTQFVHFLGLPTHLAELDISVNDYDWDAIAGEAAEVAALTNNPRAAAVEDCRAILAGCCQVA